MTTDTPLALADEDRILDAALGLFADVGVRRATIGDVAKRAGVDRVTVYRRVGSKDEVVGSVIIREAGRLFDEVLSAANRESSLAGRITVGFAETIERIRSHAMLNRMIELEPDTVFVSLSRDAGPILVAAVSVVERIFEGARADGLLDSVDGLAPVAEAFVRIAHSFVLTPSAAAAAGTHGELVDFASAALVPLLPPEPSRA